MLAIRYIFAVVRIQALVSILRLQRMEAQRAMGGLSLLDQVRLSLLLRGAITTAKRLLLMG
jgi:hypothetical protein